MLGNVEVSRSLHDSETESGTPPSVANWRLQLDVGCYGGPETRQDPRNFALSVPCKAETPVLKGQACSNSALGREVRQCSPKSGSRPSAMEGTSKYFACCHHRQRPSRQLAQSPARSNTRPGGGKSLACHSLRFFALASCLCEAVPSPTCRPPPSLSRLFRRTLSPPSFHLHNLSKIADANHLFGCCWRGSRKRSRKDGR
jgi:hypothetical protein